MGRSAFQPVLHLSRMKTQLVSASQTAPSILLTLGTVLTTSAKPAVQPTTLQTDKTNSASSFVQLTRTKPPNNVLLRVLTTSRKQVTNRANCLALACIHSSTTTLTSKPCVALSPALLYPSPCSLSIRSVSLHAPSGLGFWTVVSVPRPAPMQTLP
jgi:hypothetical protein